MFVASRDGWRGVHSLHSSQRDSIGDDVETAVDGETRGEWRDERGVSQSSRPEEGRGRAPQASDESSRVSRVSRGVSRRQKSEKQLASAAARARAAAARAARGRAGSNVPKKARKRRRQQKSFNLFQ